jgi:ascorbate-specific PTS system EIIC-type component UlaA
MAARKALLQSLKSIAGAVLLAFGFAILFANLDEVAAAASDFAGISAHQGLGVLPALSLASLHALRAYTFDHEGFVSGLLHILVSFWPLVLIFAGMVVLRRALRHRLAAPQQASQEPEANDVQSY